jgi:hypothetical protein
MVTTRDTAEPLVLEIDGRLVEGWIASVGCPHCGGPTVYYLAYAATCCPACNRWLDLECPDPECAPCRCRPGAPFDPA